LRPSSIPTPVVGSRNGPRYLGVFDSLNRGAALMNPTTSTRIPERLLLS